MQKIRPYLLLAIPVAVVLWLRPVTVEIGRTPPEANVEVQTATITRQLTPKEFLKVELRQQGLTDRDESILTEIIQCESGWEQFWPDGNVKVSSGNIGLAQINHWAHHEEYEKLGLDPYDEFQNLTYAVILYKRNGIADWEKWSDHCFLPALAEKGITF